MKPCTREDAEGAEIAKPCSFRRSASPRLAVKSLLYRFTLRMRLLNVSEM